MPTYLALALGAVVGGLVVLGIVYAWVLKNVRPWQ